MTIIYQQLYQNNTKLLFTMSFAKKHSRFFIFFARK